MSRLKFSLQIDLKYIPQILDNHKVGTKNTEFEHPADDYN